MKQNTIIAIVVILIIIIGSVYYFSRNNYGGQNTPTPTATSTPQNSNQILIKNFAFNPAEISVNKGTTVTWINKDSTTHRISGNIFQSADLSEGQSYSFTFNDSGTYDYFCGIHPSMKGKIIVK